jgi:hypothetical protein
LGTREKRILPKVEECAQAVLDARQSHLDNGTTLADLYAPLYMSAPLLKAHQNLDRAVDRCYWAGKFERERERVEFLFPRSQALLGRRCAWAENAVPGAPLRSRPHVIPAHFTTVERRGSEAELRNRRSQGDLGNEKCLPSCAAGPREPSTLTPPPPTPSPPRSATSHPNL